MQQDTGRKQTQLQFFKFIKRINKVHTLIVT